MRRGSPSILNSCAVHVEEEPVALGNVIVLAPVLGDVEDTQRARVWVGVVDVVSRVPAAPLQRVLDILTLLGSGG